MDIDFCSLQGEWKRWKKWVVIYWNSTLDYFDWFWLIENSVMHEDKIGFMEKNNFWLTSFRKYWPAALCCRNNKKKILLGMSRPLPAPARAKKKTTHPRPVFEFAQKKGWTSPEYWKAIHSRGPLTELYVRQNNIKLICSSQNLEIFLTEYGRRRGPGPVSRSIVE